MSCIVKSTPASWAMARMWRIVLVEPPMAMSRTIALSKAFQCHDLRGAWGRRPGHFDDPHGGLSVERLRSSPVARMVPLPGSAMPSASARQFMLLAVNMPEQLPQVGQAGFSMSSVFSSDQRRRLLGRPRRRRRSGPRSRPSVLARFHRPAGDEDRRDVHRMAAIIMPGTILSQLGMQIMPSNR